MSNDDDVVDVSGLRWEGDEVRQVEAMPDERSAPLFYESFAGVPKMVVRDNETGEEQEVEVKVVQGSGGMLRADGTWVSWEIDEHGNRTEWEDPEQGAIMRAVFGDWVMDALDVPPDPHAPDMSDRDLAAELRDARETYGPDSPEAMLAFQRRKAQVEAEEADEPEQWIWCSFADPDLPEGSQFLGVAIVQARGTVGAAQRCWDLGINPGGEMAPWAIGDVDNAEWIERWTNRLLSADEARACPQP